MPSFEPSWIRIQKENEWGMSIMKQKTSVSDPDPHGFGSPGSGSVLGMRIRIQQQEMFLKNPDFYPFKMASFGSVLRHITYIK
jgi:hypothetical protein